MTRALPLVAALLSGCLHFHSGAMPGEPADATFLQVEGARVRYLDVGEGAPVVLLHGFASSIENWATVIPTLKGGNRVIAIDLKGFGWTDRPVADYSPEAQAELVRAVLDERGVEQVSLVAHSWGTSVALAFALKYPARVARLVLYDAWAYDSQLPSMFHMARAQGVGEFLFSAFYSERHEERLTLGFYNPDFVTQPFVDAVERAFERPGTKAAALATVRGMRFETQEHRYGEIRIPTLLMWGREDVVTPVTIGERLLRQLPNASLKVYPRCGHFPMLEAVGQSNADLVAFLRAAP